MKLEIIKGNRKSPNLNNKTITIFLISFIYPATTGYLRRMELIMDWVNLRFKRVNLIIPVKNNNTICSAIIKLHLPKCDQLFLIKYQCYNSKFLSLKKIIYKIVTGKYPKMHSSLLLDSSLIKGFKEIMGNVKTDYFLNTRNNYAGLEYYLPTKMTRIFDTQDVYTEMYKSYSLLNVSKSLKCMLSGYREKGILFDSEISALEKYDTIIAISKSDFEKYNQISSLKSKVVKIDSIGFKPSNKPTAKNNNKKYDLLLIASDFIATRRGIDWFLGEVAPRLTEPTSLCIVGSIGKYVEGRTYKNSKLNISIKGVVKDLKPYYDESKIVVISMLEGTGTSVKGLEALAFGAAIITTSSGIRFKGLTSGKEAIITNSHNTFAQNIEKLLNNKSKRAYLGEKALEFYKKNYSLKSTYEALDNLIVSN